MTELLRLWADGKITRSEFDRLKAWEELQQVEREWKRVWNPERKRFVWRKR